MFEPAISVKWKFRPSAVVQRVKMIRGIKGSFIQGANVIGLFPKKGVSWTGVREGALSGGEIGNKTAISIRQIVGAFWEKDHTGELCNIKR